MKSKNLKNLLVIFLFGIFSANILADGAAAPEKDFWRKGWLWGINVGETIANIPQITSYDTKGFGSIASTSEDIKTSGFSGGASLGYKLNWGKNLVFIPKIDVGYADINTSQPKGSDFLGTVFNLHPQKIATMNGILTFGGGFDLGWKLNDFLPYATIGLGCATLDGLRCGPKLGGGVGYAVTRNFSVNAGYTVTLLGNSDLQTPYIGVVANF